MDFFGCYLLQLLSCAFIFYGIITVVKIRINKKTTNESRLNDDNDELDELDERKKTKIRE